MGKGVLCAQPAFGSLLWDVLAVSCLLCLSGGVRWPCRTHSFSCVFPNLGHPAELGVCRLPERLYCNFWKVTGSVNVWLLDQ